MIEQKTVEMSAIPPPPATFAAAHLWDDRLGLTGRLALAALAAGGAAVAVAALAIRVGLPVPWPAALVAGAPVGALAHRTSVRRGILVGCGAVWAMVIARAIVAPVHPGSGLVEELARFHETADATTAFGYLCCALVAGALAARGPRPTGR